MAVQVNLRSEIGRFGRIVGVGGSDYLFVLLKEASSDVEERVEGEFVDNVCASLRSG